MTGYRSRFLRHDCDAGGNCFIEKLPSWDALLDGADFPRGIIPMDIDGFVEINGHYLFLEQKGPGVILCQPGQGHALRSLARLLRVTVAFFRPAGDDAYDVIWNTTGDPTAIVRASQDQLAAMLHAWALNADAEVAA
jgi:hypothetical protein